MISLSHQVTAHERTVDSDLDRHFDSFRESEQSIPTMNSLNYLSACGRISPGAILQRGVCMSARSARSRGHTPMALERDLYRKNTQ